MCPVPDAPHAEPGSQSGEGLRLNELDSVAQALLQLVAAMERRDRLLVAILEQNAAILEAMAAGEEEEQDDDPQSYLSGALIRS